MRYLFGLLISATTIVFGLKVGDLAPDFEKNATDGKSYRLSQVIKQHEAVAVVFIATQCPYSNLYNGRYNELVNEFKSKLKDKIGWVAINSNDTESMEDVKKHARDSGFQFAVLKDAFDPTHKKKKVAELFGAEKTPEAFLIQKQGMKIVYHGRIDDDSEGKNITSRDLRVAIEQLLGGKEILVKETKAFGCSIKNR